MTLFNAHQYDVDLTLGALPARIVWLVELPVVVELDHVSVGFRWKLRHHIIHILVLQQQQHHGGNGVGRCWSHAKNKT